MKLKFLFFSLVSLLLLFSFVACQKEKAEKPMSTISATTTEAPTTTVPTTVATTAPKEPQSGKPITYYTEDSSNPYIQKIVKKYGVDASHVIALIRTNTKLEGATILEFSGDTDKGGNLLKNENTLVAVYDIEKSSGRIRKATADGSGNDGYTTQEGKAVFALAKRFMLPNLSQMKAERISQPAK